MFIIETEGLRKSFAVRSAKGRPGGQPRSRKGCPKSIEAVRGLDMQVETGEIFGFLGPNGAGKSTTLRMLATLLPPSGGRATVAGYDLLRAPGQVRWHIGYVGQAGGTDKSSTARENLILQGQLYAMAKGAAEARAAELITALDLEPLADRLARTYSGGQRRRLDLALGMVHQPALLFLDEPTAGLDPQSRAWLWDEVRRLRASGATIFLTTHHLEEADALCDRLAIIDEGRIVAEGTPAALKQQIAGDIITLGFDPSDGIVASARRVLDGQPSVRELHEGPERLQLHVEHGEEALPGILHLLEDAGIEIRTVSLARPTLDDVFLRKTGRSLREVAH